MSNEQLREALQRIQYKAVSLADAQVIALEALASQTTPPAAPSQEPAVPQGWTDADSDAARLALELECLLLDTENLSVVSKWWASANEALELHRRRLATPAAPSQEPVPEGLVAYSQHLDKHITAQEPVTLTEREIGDCIDKTNRESQYGHHHFGWSKDLAANIIAALREKEQTK